MNHFQIPKYQVNVTIFQANMPPLKGEIYLSNISEYYPGKERPSEIWKEEGFIAFKSMARDFQLFNNKYIMAMTVSSEDQLGDLQFSREDLLGEFSQKIDLIVTMNDHRQLSGRLFYMQPHNSQRLIDFMNTNENSILLRDADKIHIINKSHIMTVKIPVSKGVSHGTN